MEQITNVAGWVDQIDKTAVKVTEEMVRAGFGVQPPTVHVLLDGLDPAYIGYMTCRQFYRGRDAEGAVAAMGLLGSQLGASRLVVTYERADMAIAWDDPHADQVPTGVVVVDAGRESHTVRWHPVLMTAGPPGPDGAATFRTEWGPPAHVAGGLLPPAVAGLLSVWREPRTWPQDEFMKIYAGWELGGYSVRWVQRPPDESGQPSWMRLLAPVM